MTGPVWVDGLAYEAYVGRWSRRVAMEFLSWLDQPLGRRWLDVGCGTGALTSTVLAMADPSEVTGVDPSAGFVTRARALIEDGRAEFLIGDARSLPVSDGSVDVVVSGLMLNFVPEPTRAVAEVARVLAPGGVAAAYVWDYAEGMAMMRHFWDAAAALDPSAAERDEGRRRGVCDPEALRELWADAGLRAVTVQPIEVPTVFAGFDDYWTPFLGGQGTIPGYVRSLPEPQRNRLRDLLAARLPVEPDGSIRLTARAWAVRGNAAG
ncbi:methyltransferase domain-containing protein [Micromonospora sp. NPDC094482]|uniref:class I SAM-dependent methyltransferase n=1 Tax=unclassified Micromonospora TaxID=2617518 RepID=UPI0033233435